jgi:hypothetical protein
MSVTSKHADFRVTEVRGRKEELLICNTCKQHGHLMKVYLTPYVDRSGKTKVRLYNYYSMTRHFYMTLENGKDFN